MYAREVAIPVFLGDAASTCAARERRRDSIGRLWCERCRDRPELCSSTVLEEDAACLWGSAAARCARAGRRGVSPGVQPLAAPTDPFSKAFTPENNIASQTRTLSRYVANGPFAGDVRKCYVDRGFFRDHVESALTSVPIADVPVGRGDMPAFSAAWIDAMSRAACRAGFRSRTSLSDWGVRCTE